MRAGHQSPIADLPDDDSLETDSTTVPPGWQSARVAAREDWAPGLFSLTLDAPAPPFEPGQFVNLGMLDPRGWLQRSYSLANAPGSAAEVFVVRVADGMLSPALDALNVGDPVGMAGRVAGHFTLSRVPDAPVLWLMATGTGLAPYLSMLRAGATRRFGRVVVVHGVRDAAHLAYSNELAAMDGVLHLGLVSRGPGGALAGRITDRLRDGSLEEVAGAELRPEAAQVLLCGNPEMVAQVHSLLMHNGLRANRPRAPGHITVERYWQTLD